MDTHRIRTFRTIVYLKKNTKSVLKLYSMSQNVYSLLDIICNTNFVCIYDSLKKQAQKPNAT